MCSRRAIDNLLNAASPTKYYSTVPPGGLRRRQSRMQRTSACALRCREEGILRNSATYISAAPGKGLKSKSNATVIQGPHYVQASVAWPELPTRIGRRTGGGWVLFWGSDSSPTRTWRVSRFCFRPPVSFPAREQGDQRAPLNAAAANTSFVGKDRRMHVLQLLYRYKLH